MLRSFPTRGPAAVALAVLALAPACSDEVVSVLPVSSVEVQPGEVSLMEGETRELSAVLRASGGEVLGGRDISWRSDAPSVANVDPTGRVTAAGLGATVIRGTSEGIEGMASVYVVEGPTIGLSRTTLSFRGVTGRGRPAEQLVQVTNSGAGTLTGLSATAEQAGEPEPVWLEAALLGSTTAPTTLRVWVETAELAVGTYRGSVVVASSVEGVEREVIDVELEVEMPSPEISVDSDVVSLSGVTGDVQPATQTVDVANAGGGVLGSLAASTSYPGEQPAGWLVAELMSEQAPTTLLLSASPRELPPDTYDAVVTLSSPDAAGGGVTVRVVFTVSPRGAGPSPSGSTGTGSGAEERP